MLVAVATSLAYLLAAGALDPRVQLPDRNPQAAARPSSTPGSTTLNLNDRTPLFTRYLTWAAGVVHGDFGETVTGDPVERGPAAPGGRDLPADAAGLAVGSVAGVLWARAPPSGSTAWLDRVTTGLSFGVLAIPTVVLANMLVLGATWFNDLVGHRVLLVSGESTPGLTRGLGPGCWTGRSTSCCRRSPSRWRWPRSTAATSAT